MYVSNQASTLRSFAAGYGSIAAHNRESPTDPSGFSFVGCQLLGTGYNYLGRAMGHYSRIIYSECYMEDMIAPQVWDDWNHDTTRDGYVRALSPSPSLSIWLPNLPSLFVGLTWNLISHLVI